MVESFVLWVMGVIEDTPLPYEVKFFTFCLHEECGNSYISFGGNEILPSHIFNFEYYPLDAQFFGPITLPNFSLFSLRKLLEKAIKDKSFAASFSNKNIFFGRFGQNKTYKLDI